MKTVLLEELDPQTSEWLRDATRHGEPLTVTDHGMPILTLTINPPPTNLPKSRGFNNRVLLPGFKAIMDGLGRGGTDSTQIISEDRDRGVE